MAVGSDSVGGSNLSDALDGGAGAGGILEGGATSFESAGADTGTSRGTFVQAAGSAHTKGSYTELIASTAADYTGVILTLSRPNASTRFMIDIATGAAASETDIISNLLFVTTADTMVDTAVYFPIDVGAGSRISARVQSAAASAFLDITVIGLIGGTSSGVTSVATLNADTAATDAASLDLSGASANVKTSYQEIIASTADAYRMLFVNVFNKNSSQLSDTNYLTDLATGAAASEEVLIPNINSKCDGTADRTSFVMGPLPVSLDASTRLAFRAQTDQPAASVAQSIQLLGIV